MTQTTYVTGNTTTNFKDILENRCINGQNELMTYGTGFSSVMVVSVSALITAIAQAIASAIHVDLIHIGAVSLSLLFYLCFIVFYFGLETHSEANMFVLCTSILLLIVGRSMDRSKRMHFAHHVETKDENKALQERIKKVIAFCVHEEYEEQEKMAVDTTLEGKFGELLTPFRIPLDHLVLEECIGTGAYGEVIRCEYFSTKVVLKRMHRNKINETSMNVFAQEILLMSELRHPNIVQFLGASWNTYSNIGFVLEFVGGDDLFQVIHDKTVPKSCSDPFHRIAVDAARGICYLHGRNILHRDLKSMNILVSETYCGKVCDFGLSVGVESLEKNDKQVGTPLWTAPEVIEAAQYSEKSDVFAYGIILIEILSQKIPDYEQTKNSSAYSIMLRVANEGLRPDLPEHLPKQVCNLIKKCLDQDPIKRPSMQLVLEELNTKEIIEFHVKETWAKVSHLVRENITRHSSFSAAILASQSAKTKTSSIENKQGVIPSISLDGEASDEDDEEVEVW